MTERDSAIVVGIEILSATEAQELANGGQNAGYTFGLLQLLRPHVQQLTEAPQTLAEKVQLVETAFSRSHLQLSNAAWAGYIVGGISPWVQLDSDNHAVRESAELLVKQQIQWASHMGLSAIVFTCPAEGPIVNFARLVNQVLSMVAYTQVLIRITLDPEIDPWGRWNLIRNLCDHNPKLSLALELTQELPDDALLKKWFAEPVRTVIVPGNAFLTNNKGFPVLSKRHQQFARDLMEHDVQQFVVSLETPESVHEAGGLPAYQQYLHYLHRTRPELNEVDKFANGYHDYLQSPLQPLMDNLESATYEVFEKDPVKYREYEKAVYQALCDRKPDSGTCVVMVVGAGRGPLVERVLRAADAANRAVRVYAVEKNPNAVVTLRCRKEDEWADRVTVVHCDMRYWEAPEKADILVSELLGSLGDNELSPECLDGAQRFLTDDGISIPCNYTAYVAPISSTKLFNEVSAYKDQEHMETPYVVKFRAVHELAEPVAIWKFEHPNRVARINPGKATFNAHNTRYSSSSFFISHDAILHGVAGYFEAVLYKNVMISIHPKTHSPGMFSWFPLFFPLKTPIFLPADSTVDLHFWRLCDARKVWYEWAAIPQLTGESGQTALVGGSSTLHNPGGRSSWIGL